MEHCSGLPAAREFHGEPGYASGIGQDIEQVGVSEAKVGNVPARKPECETGADRGA